MTVAIPTFWVLWLAFGAYMAYALEFEGARPSLLFRLYWIFVGPLHLLAEELDRLSAWVAAKTLTPDALTD